jgi:hypothetical protein
LTVHMLVATRYIKRISRFQIEKMPFVAPSGSRHIGLASKRTFLNV